MLFSLTKGELRPLGDCRHGGNDQACSFTAEGESMVHGLSLIATPSSSVRAHSNLAPSLRAWTPKEEYKGRPLIALWDSRSWLESLKRGPAAQRFSRGQDIWAALCGLTEAGATCEFMFAYSHVPTSIFPPPLRPLAEAMDKVDTLAKSALKLPQTAPIAAVDETRTARTTAFARATTSALSKGNARAQWRPKPTDWKRDDRATRSTFVKDSYLLPRARCGVLPRLGSIEKGRPTPCRLCGAKVMCRSAAVTHIFSCAAPAAAAARADTDVHAIADLWSRPRQSTEFLYRFTTTDPDPPADPPPDLALFSSDDASDTSEE